MPILNTAHIQSYITVLGERVEINTDSNVHKTNNLNTDLTLTKTASKSWGMPENKLTISTQIVNNTDITLTDITFKSEINEATFVDGSLKINSQSRTEFNPATGFAMPVTLGAGTDVVVEYEVSINKYPETDTATDVTTLTIDINSNEYNIQSSALNIDIVTNDLAIRKSADKTAVVSGSILTYTFEISNSGPYTHTDLFFTDSIPQGTEFVEDSVTINGVTQMGYSPIDGFSLSNMAQNETKTITFQVSVK